jgi:PAS domain S-box-containing protein
MIFKNSKLNLVRWFILRPKTTGVLSSLILSGVIAIISYQEYQIAKEYEQKKISNALEIIHQNINKSLNSVYTSTLAIALTINNDGLPGNFDGIGKKLLQSNKLLSSLELAPKGLRKYIYPRKGNEDEIGLNILNDARQKRKALLAIQNQKMYFVGPLNLKKGGYAVIGRLPIFKDNTFWGFSTGIIKLKDLLMSAGVYNIDSSKYYFQLSKLNPTTKKEVCYLPIDNSFSKNYSVSYFIPDGNWKLTLTSKHPNFLQTKLLAPAILGLMLAVLFGFIINLILKKPAELQFRLKEQAFKLLDGEIKYRRIFDEAAIGIAYSDPNDNYFLEANKKYCELLGYSASELKEMTFESLTHPDDLQKDLSSLKEITQGRITKYSMEKRYITKFGTTIWVNLTISPLFDSDKKVSKVIALVEDITSKKESEALIKKSESHFKSLFKDSPLPLCEQDFSEVKLHLLEHHLMNKKKEIVIAYLRDNPKFIQKLESLVKIVHLNKACLELYKVNSKEELFNIKYELSNKISQSDFINQIVAITQNKYEVIVDTTIKNSKQELRFINLRWNVLSGYEDSLERVIVSSIDITERKNTEKEISNSKLRIESLINTIDGIVWESKAESNVLSFIDTKVEDILGYPTKEWLSRPFFWEENIHKDDREVVLAYYNKNKKLDRDFEYRMMAKNGTVVWFRDVVNVVIENDKVVSLYGILIDITKSKEAEKELQNSFNLVKEQNKRLLNFSYIVSHNLRSHTSNIASLMSLIDSSDSEEQKRQFLLHLKSVSNSLNETMENLNEVINIRNNIGLVSQPLNLSQYVASAQQVLSEQITTKEASFLTEIPSDLLINYNPAYLESVLYNIISNSIRYSHPDRKPIINIKWFMEEEMNVLVISDNGVGIDLVKNADKIFGMYKTFSNNPESKGIGLFIAKNQIDAMDGNIMVESQPNIGTTFKIYIR